MSGGTTDCGIVPRNNMVIVEPRDSFEHASGLVLPQAYDDDAHGGDGDMIRQRNQLCLAVVRGVGPGEWRQGDNDDGTPGPLWQDTPPVEVGEQVMYLRANAVPIKDSDPLLVMVPDAAIFMRVEGEARQVADGIVSAGEEGDRGD